MVCKFMYVVDFLSAECEVNNAAFKDSCLNKHDLSYEIPHLQQRETTLI